jgi:hypothetical protein
MDNRDVIDIFGQLLSNKNMIIGKARQTGKSSSKAILDWKKVFDKYNRAQDRKETIKRIFNI